MHQQGEQIENDADTAYLVDDGDTRGIYPCFRSKAPFEVFVGGRDIAAPEKGEEPDGGNDDCKGHGKAGEKSKPGGSVGVARICHKSEGANRSAYHGKTNGPAGEISTPKEIVFRTFVAL